MRGTKMIGMTTVAELELALLRKLYETWCMGNGTERLGVFEWASEAGVDWKLAERCLRDLTERGLAKVVAMGARVTLSAQGVLHAENQVPVEVRLPNQLLRERILLACLGKEEHEDRPRVRWETLLQETGAEDGGLERNAMLLKDLFLGTWSISGYYQLTATGVQAALRVQAVRARAERFERLKEGADFSEQQRGHEVEVLLDEIANSESWATERNVRATGEEQDLVINKGPEYYLLESRWLKKPVEASAVREFSERVTARSGVGGLFFSMSGFSSGAVKWAEERLSSRLMLFFGPKDIEGLMTGQASFSDLLAEKRHAAISRRRVSFG